MNKQTAQEQMTVLQAEMDKLKSIIDKPEAKTGRVLSVDDLELNKDYWFVGSSVCRRATMDKYEMDRVRIEMGNAFHDKETAEQYSEYLNLEQELRITQAADGGAGGELVIVIQDNMVVKSYSVYFHKVSFNSTHARKDFRTAHTDEQLTLLIRGV